jgi:hypothetical protein
MFLRSLVVGLVLASSPLPAATDQRAPARAAGGGPATRAAHPPAQRTQRLVFSCREASLVIFSDRPCGMAAVRRSLEILTPPATGAPPTTAPAPAPAAARPAAREDKPIDDRHAERCESLQSTLDAIDSRMRSGYSAREAPRLWQQWRDAREHLRDARC